MAFDLAGAARRYLPVAGLALACRLALAICPVEALLTGAALAPLPVVWDLLFVLPEGMHVLGWRSIPFYTLGAIIVEIAQHILPMLVWLAVAGQLLLRGGYRRWAYSMGAVLVAAVEPVMLLGGPFFEGYGPGFYIIGALAIYAVNIVQLYVFRYFLV